MKNSEQLEELKKEVLLQFSALTLTDNAEREFHLLQVEKYIDRTWNLAMERAEEIANNHKKEWEHVNKRSNCGGVIADLISNEKV